MQYVKIESGQISTVWLNRPDKHNALLPEMIQELTEAFRSPPEEARMILLRGEGKSFCAGADLDYMKSMANYSREQNIADSRELTALFYAILNCPLPVVCIAHGNIYGGGIGVVAACDIILAEKDAKFCFSEVKLGLAPAVISPVCTARIGFSASRRYFLTGEVFGSSTARDINLVQEVYEADFQSTLEPITKALTTGAPGAQASIKQLTNRLLSLDEKGELQTYTAELIAELRAGAEGQEGMASFFEKRKPSWRG